MMNLNKENLVTLSHKDRVVTNYMERLNSVNRGLEHGIEQNITETCIRMHDNGLNNDTISVYLNITKEEVDEILKNNK